MLSFDDVYVTCDNCDIKINTDNHQIFCLYSGEQSKPDKELTICENCNFDLKIEFKKEGYKCDDWDLEDSISNSSNENEIGNCGNCSILLDDIRDGTVEDGHRCNNCYWEDVEGKSKIILPDYREIVPKPFLKVSNDKVEEYYLCRNEDCVRFPDDEMFDKDNEEEYEDSEWIKCSLCDGYFNDDGLNDILFIEEEPNNYNHSCDLCGKTKNIVQMKSTGQFICQNACDESDNESDEESS